MGLGSLRRHREARDAARKRDAEQAVQVEKETFLQEKLVSDPAFKSEYDAIFKNEDAKTVEVEESEE